jgi:hypothetical protein
MRKMLYKVYLAMLNNKFVDMSKVFVLSYDTIAKSFVFWYIDSDNRLQYYDDCKKSSDAKFKWNILMCRGGSF